MLALLSVWTGLAALALAVLMLAARTWFTDAWLTVTLYTAILSLTLAGLTFWSLRKEKPGDDPGVAARRTQCRVGVGLSLTAIAIVYGLVAQVARRAG
ncbi:MAG: hypothetical protein HRF43_20010 [Phycisphaerae bacterium]|jgi:hypothetical protein